MSFSIKAMCQHGEIVHRRKTSEAALKKAREMLLGIVGAFVATYLGQSLGWYRPAEGDGRVGAIVCAIIVLLIYGFVARRRRTI